MTAFDVIVLTVVVLLYLALCLALLAGFVAYIVDWFR